MRKLTIIAAVVASIAAGSALAQTDGMSAMKSEPGKVSMAEAISATASVEVGRQGQAPDYAEGAARQYLRRTGGA